MPRTPKFSTPGSVASPVMSPQFPSQLFGSKSQFSSPNSSSKVSNPTDRGAGRRGGGPSRNDTAGHPGKRKRQQQQQQQLERGAAPLSSPGAKNGPKREKKQRGRARPEGAEAGGHGADKGRRVEAGSGSGGALAKEAEVTGRIEQSNDSDAKRRKSGKKRNGRERTEKESATVPPASNIQKAESSERLAVTDPPLQPARAAPQRQRGQRGSSQAEEETGKPREHPHQRQRAKPKALEGKRQEKQRRHQRVPTAEPRTHTSGETGNNGDKEAHHRQNTATTMTTATANASSISSSLSMGVGSATATCPSVSAPSTATATPVLRPTGGDGPPPHTELPPPLPPDPAIVAVVGMGGAADDAHVPVAAAAAPTHPKRKRKPKGADHPTTTTITTRTTTNTRVMMQQQQQQQQAPRDERRKGSNISNGDSVISGKVAASASSSAPQPPTPLASEKDEAGAELSRRGLRVDAPAFVPRSVSAAVLSSALSPSSLDPRTATPDAPEQTHSLSMFPTSAASSPAHDGSPQHYPPPRMPVVPPAFIEGASSVSSSRQLSCVVSPVANSSSVGPSPPFAPPVHLSAPKSGKASPAALPSQNPAHSTPVDDRDANYRSRRQNDLFPQAPFILRSSALATAGDRRGAAAAPGVSVSPGTPPIASVIAHASSANPSPSDTINSLSPKGLTGFAPTFSMSSSGVIFTPNTGMPPTTTRAGGTASVSSANAASPLGAATTASTSATRNDTDNVRHTRLTMPDNLSEDRMYHLLEAGDHDDDINGPGVEFYEAAAATASRARSAPSLLRVVSAHAIAQDNSASGGDLRRSSSGGSPVCPTQGPAQRPDSEGGPEDDEEELFPAQGGRGSSVLSTSTFGGVGAAAIAMSPCHTRPEYMADRNAILAPAVGDEWETRSTTSALSYHPRRAGNGGGYWGLEGPQASFGLFPPIPSRFLAAVGGEPSHELSSPGAAAAVQSSEWPASPHAIADASLEYLSLQQQEWHHQQHIFYDAEDPTAQDYEDVWEVNSSAYEQESLDEVQAEWIEAQLQATENPKGFFPF